MIFNKSKVLYALGGLTFLGWAFFLKTLSWVAFSYTALGLNPTPKTFLVKPGASLSHIASKLKEENLIESIFPFKVHALFQGVSLHLKTGEYEFPPYATQEEILKSLHKGAVLQHSVTLPEGITLEQAIATLNTDPNLKGPPLSLKDFAQSPPLAETYFLTRGTTRQNFLKRMHADFRNLLNTLWESRIPTTPLKSPKDALILAAIVEKETAIPSERPMIAAVFLNRLRIGMPLQSDPTVSYGLHRETGRPLNQTLNRKDLKTPHAYNTYLNKGLPPHPIALVGKEALRAVFAPVNSKNLYFVADGTGGHL
ncbi:MAG: endolytic transglycosylase MltG [bacterium]|nr:endolytic transglycosylase MltG [bacterium]